MVAICRNVVYAMSMTKYYTVRQVAEHYAVTAQTVRSLIKDGEIPAIKVKRDYRIPVEAIEAKDRAVFKAA